MAIGWNTIGGGVGIGRKPWLMPLIMALPAPNSAMPRVCSSAMAIWLSVCCGRYCCRYSISRFALCSAVRNWLTHCIGSFMALQKFSSLSLIANAGEAINNAMNVSKVLMGHLLYIYNGTPLLKGCQHG